MLDNSTHFCYNIEGISISYMWNVCKYSYKRGEIMDDSSSRSKDKVFVYSHNMYCYSHIRNL